MATLRGVEDPIGLAISGGSHLVDVAAKVMSNRVALRRNLSHGSQDGRCVGVGKQLQEVLHGSPTGGRPVVPPSTLPHLIKVRRGGVGGNSMISPPRSHRGGSRRPGRPGSCHHLTGDPIKSPPGTNHVITISGTGGETVPAGLAPLVAHPLPVTDTALDPNGIPGIVQF